MFLLYIIISLVINGTLIGKLELLHSETYMELGGEKILFWPPASIKFSLYILSGRVIQTFKNEKIDIKLLAYATFILDWGIILWAIMQ